MVSEVTSTATAMQPSQRPAQASRPEGVPPTELRPGGAQPASEQARSTEKASEEQRRDPASEKKALDEAVQQISDHIQNLRRELQFNIDDATGRTVVKVIDAETDEVIRQIPSEEILRLAERMKSMDHGEEVQGLILRTQV